MARPIKNGLNYFPFDVDFFEDRKIRVLRAAYGADGIEVYIYLLTLIYRDKGYYIVYDDDMEFIISDELNMKREKIGQIINFLLERSLFCDKLFKSDKVLTSRGIQLRYQKAKTDTGLRRGIEVNEKFWVLSESETQSHIKFTHFSDSAEKNADYLPNNSCFEDEKLHKEKESKENKSIIKESKETKSTLAVSCTDCEQTLTAESEMENVKTTATADNINNNELERLVELYKNSIGQVTENIRDKLCEYLKTADISLIEYAIEQACEYEKRNFSYIKRILDSKLAVGIRCRANTEPYNRNNPPVPNYKGINNYTDTNKRDYARTEEELLEQMMSLNPDEVFG